MHLHAPVFPIMISTIIITVPVILLFSVKVKRKLLCHSVHTFVLFLHAQRRPLEFGFYVMINCWRENQQLQPLTVTLGSREWANIINRITEWRRVRPLSCSPSGLVFLYLPTRCPSTCQSLTAAAVAHQLFRHTHTVPQWELCSAEWTMTRQNSSVASG